MKWLIVAILLLATPALADIELSYSWDVPTTGTAVVHYQVQTTRAGEDWTDYGLALTAADTFLVPDGVQDFQIRVAGVDAFDRIGPWSAPSELFTDDGPPGMPGTPQLVGTILALLGLLAFVLFFRKER